MSWVIKYATIMKPSQTRTKIVEELLNDVAYYDGDVILYKTNGKVLSEVLTQALNDYTQSIIEMVDKSKKRAWDFDNNSFASHIHNQALEDIKEELNK